MRKQNNKKKSSRSGMSVLHSEKGVVLVMTLVLSVISLASMAALMLMATDRTQIAAGLPRYVTACDAVKAGGNIFIQAINERDVPNVASELTNFLSPATALDSPIADTKCFEAKLENVTADWATGCSDSKDIDSAYSSTYDISFDLGTGPVYSVYAKIADTISGNSGKETGLLANIGVVHSHMTTIITPPSPFLYGVEVCAVAQTKAAEECCMSLLYQF